MDIWTGFQMYLLGAIAISGTSYFNIYRPAISLLEEIVEEKTTYSSPLGGITWIVVSTIAAPVVLYALLANDNTGFIQTLATTLANKYLEEEE